MSSDPEREPAAPAAESPTPVTEPSRSGLPPSEPSRSEPSRSEPSRSGLPPSEPTRSGPALSTPALSKPPRSAMSMRDMAVAVAVLAGIILLFGGLTRSCSFAPAGPTSDPAGIPVVDAPAALRALRVPFPVRIPAVPPGWRSNSVAQDRVAADGVAADGVDGARVVRIGYLTPEGRYLRLLQSSATEEALLAVETGASPVVAAGPIDVAGQRWIVHSRGGDEPIWTADVPTPGAGSLRMLITGSGSGTDMRTLATTALTGDLLPARSP